MTIQAAVTNVAKYIGADSASAELLEGYLALTDCILSTIKGKAFTTKSTKVNGYTKHRDHPSIKGLISLGYKDN